MNGHSSTHSYIKPERLKKRTTRCFGLLSPLQAVYCSTLAISVMLFSYAMLSDEHEIKQMMVPTKPLLSERDRFQNANTTLENNDQVVKAKSDDTVNRAGAGNVSGKEEERKDSGSVQNAVVDGNRTERTARHRPDQIRLGQIHDNETVTDDKHVLVSSMFRHGYAIWNSEWPLMSLRLNYVFHSQNNDLNADGALFALDAVTPLQLRRSRTNTGNTFRLQRAIHKLEARKRGLVIAVFGGSVSYGIGCSRWHQDNYAAVLERELNKHMPCPGNPHKVVSYAKRASDAT
jgi:hypothetical protein